MVAAIDEDAEADAATGGVMGIAVLRARVRRFGEQPSRGGSRTLRERVDKAVVVCREQRSRARERQIGRSILKEADGDVIAARSNLPFGAQHGVFFSFYAAARVSQNAGIVRGNHPRSGFTHSTCKEWKRAGRPTSSRDDDDDV